MLLNGLEAQGFAARTLNHIRFGAFSVFEHARSLAQRKWLGENPVAAVKWRAPSKSGPAKAANVLRREEVAAVLSAFPEPSLEQPWRWVAGTCILTGARPGEVMGARKEDINTDDWTWNICRSWDNDKPKDGEPRTVVIVPELRPLLEAAMTASTSERIICRPDGTPYDPSVRHGLVDHLHGALKRAGVVTGYKHKCRRKGCAYVETRQASSESRCPRCNMRLWVTPIPRPLRFYDLRHTHATLLRRAGVDLGAVQKGMGHSSPELTGHLALHPLDKTGMEGAAGLHPMAPVPPAVTPFGAYVVQDIQGPFMAVRDVATWLHSSRATVYRLFRAGTLQGLRVSNAIRIPAVALDDMQHRRTAR